MFPTTFANGRFHGQRLQEIISLLLMYVRVLGPRALFVYQRGEMARNSDDIYVHPELCGIQNSQYLNTIFISSGGGRFSPLGTPAMRPLYQPWMMRDKHWALGGMRIDRINRSTSRKPAPVPICPPKTWNRTRAPVMGIRRLTAFARNILIKQYIYIYIYIYKNGCVYVCISGHNPGMPGAISTKYGTHIAICMCKNLMYVLYIFCREDVWEAGNLDDSHCWGNHIIAVVR
jgi:hypothetical protein